MREIDGEYPAYGFMKNKGLGLVVGGIFVVTLIISAINRRFLSAEV